MYTRITAERRGETTSASAQRGKVEERGRTYVDGDGHKADRRDEVRDVGALGVGHRSLDRRKGGSSSDSLAHESGFAFGPLA